MDELQKCHSPCHRLHIRSYPESFTTALLNPPEGLESSGSTVSIVDDFGSTSFQGLIKGYEIFLKIPSLKNKCTPLDQVDEIWSLAEEVRSSKFASTSEDPSIFLSFWASIDLLVKASSL
jgi:hypothetical protein